MPNEKPLILEGEVTQVLPNVMFRVLLDTTGSEILCYANGNLKRNFIKILEGDRVRVEMSPYDLTRGRISRRL